MGKNSAQRRKKKLKEKEQDRKAKEAKMARQHEMANRGTVLLDLARRNYVEEWMVTSSFFEAEMHYEWMAGRIEGFRRVLEIGCGVGYSTLALAKAGHDVVVMEENPAFIDEARARLLQNGFTASACKRGTAVDDPRDRTHYCVQYEAVNIEQAPIMLVEGDAVDDKKFLSWLKSTPPFDAIVCWLLGTHEHRGRNTCKGLVGVSDSSQNRLVTQNRIYELANVALRPGGVLNIVDRMEYPEDQRLIDDLLRSHREQASVTTLRVRDNLESREYREPDAPNATRMVMRVPSQRGMPEIRRLALCSITSMKPLEDSQNDDVG